MPTKPSNQVTTPEYFALGLDTFLKIQDTLLKEMSIPVRVVLRALAAHDHTSQCVAVPLVVLERQDGG